VKPHMMSDIEKVEKSEDNWSTHTYATNASFVPRLTSKVISYLDPSCDDVILDVGAGDGALTLGIKKRCKMVLALDSSKNFTEGCKAKGLDARLVDCRKLSSEKDLRGTFDKVFSNAALHWILADTQTRATVAPAIYACLKPNGIFVAECGCFGNVADVVTAIRSSLVHYGLSYTDVDAVNPWFFPTPPQMKLLLENAGFTACELEQEHRPTELSGDIIEWIETFAFSFLKLVVDVADRARILQEIKEALRWSCQRSDGVWVVNYVRLRWKARRP